MNTGTIARTITSAIVAVHAVLVMFGVTGFEGVTEDAVYKVVSAVVTIVTWAVALYKNNDFTAEAAEATGFMRMKKATKKNVNGENFFDEVEEIEGDEDNA